MANTETLRNRRTAYHEAAHAVVFAISQLPFTKVGIHKSRKAVKKYNRLGYLVDEHRMVNIRQAAAICVANYASIPAEQILEPRPTWFYSSVTSCADDCRNAEAIAEDWGFDRKLAMDAAASIVQLARDAIDVVAQALIKRRELGYEEVLTMLAVLPSAVLLDCEYQIWRLTRVRNGPSTSFVAE